MTKDQVDGRSDRVVAVVGLGLMGGSLCRALKSRDEAPVVLGVDSDVVQGTLARAAGVVDRFEAEAESLLAEADVVVYATPLSVSLELMREHAPSWRDDALVTDMVSLKAPLLRLARTEGFTDRYIGGHPVCGGEASGFAASRRDLFRDATVWLCASDDVPSALRSRVEAFWKSVGAEPHWSQAAEHDARMGWVSHLPQLVANALAGALDAAGYANGDLGPGGRDMTRLAGSNPQIWRDLLQESAPVIGTGLTSVSNALNVLADLLARREVDRVVEFMERTRQWREGQG